MFVINSLLLFSYIVSYICFSKRLIQSIDLPVQPASGLSVRLSAYWHLPILQCSPRAVPAISCHTSCRLIFAFTCRLLAGWATYLPICFVQSLLGFYTDHLVGVPTYLDSAKNTMSSTSISYNGSKHR